MMRPKDKPEVRSLVIHLPLLLLGITMIFPLLWMLSASLKSPGQQFAFPPRFIPDPLYVRNYVDLFSAAPMAQYLVNSTKIAVFSVIGTCLSSSLAAFAFARMRFWGKNVLFVALLATMMIPVQVTIIPTFVLMRRLGLIDSHLALILPNFFGAAFNVFLLSQFYLSIPQDLVDAARIDGAGFFRIYWSIFLPLGRPALAVVAVFNFLWSWNDLLGPLIFLNSQEKMTVSQGLTMLMGRAESSGASQWGVVMAGALLGVLPMLVLYFFAQKYFVQGLTRTGLKG